MAFGDYTIGSSGSGVADLQRYLREVGFNVTIDGQYGQETRAAVIAFQQARGVRVDGIADPETLVALSVARAEGWRAAVPAAQATVDANAPIVPAPKPGSKWAPLVILLALAIGAWVWKAKKGGSRRAGRQFAEDDPVEVEEPDEEPEEETDEDGEAEEEGE